MTAQQPKWQSSCSKMWSIEQLYIELGLELFEGFDTKARAHEQKGVILFYFSSKGMAGQKAFTVDLRF